MGGKALPKPVALASWSVPAHPRLPAAAGSTARTLSVHRRGASGPSEAPTSLEAPRPVTWNLQASQILLEIGRAGLGWAGLDWAGLGLEVLPRLTLCLDSRSHLSMLVHPRAPQGVLLFAAPQTRHSPSLLLFLSHGHFVLQTEGPRPRLRVRSRQRSRAGRWHMVRV